MKNDMKIVTIIGKGTIVSGDFSATGSTRLDGTIEGNVKVSGQLIIGACGKVLGNVDASAVVVGGEVLGNILAPVKAELTGTARVIGDIKTQAIVIDEKAIFQGKCDMDQDEQKAKRRPVRETRAGKKTAKDALKEALQEMENENDGADVAAANVETTDNTEA